MKPATAEQVEAWVKRTTFEQGVEAKVTDAQTVKAVVVLLREGRQPQPVRVRDAREG